MKLLDLEHPAGVFLFVFMVLFFCASSVVLSLCITGDIHKLNCSVNCDCKEDDVKYLSPPVPSGSN